MSRHAVCVGINAYPGTGADLRGCVNDAHDWSDRLRARGYDVEVILDEEATRARLIEALADVVTSAAPGDRVMITYSGHGSSFAADTSTGRREVLCPTDIADGNAIADVELASVLGKRRPGAQLTTVLDCCHAGGLDRDLTSSSWWRSSWWTGADRYLDPGQFLPALSEAVRNRRLPTEVLGGSTTRDIDTIQSVGATGLILEACQADQTARDAVFDARPNGAFSYVATRSIDTLGSCSCGAWFQAIRERLPSAVYPQEPRLVGTLLQSLWPALG